MKHALVVGGTGMLSDVSLWLVDRGYHVSIIARNSNRMEKLMSTTHLKDNITPLLVDYTDGEKLQEQIHYTVEKNGSIDIVVAWIHSVAEHALSVIINEVSQKQDEWELFHILGSSSDLDRIKQKASVPENCLYYQIQLGFVNDGSHSRWLTNAEISAGVMEGIKKKERVHTVGQLEPWENRP
ncbi:short-chain dehydrogenase [Aquibacillus koreensis]|uniref:Short-chain dehydrogenase n=1 Tax=Aquibacillus koreensis TaxID=279446 RepID=A0A9X3WJR2_9BACI|nr:short-chain dehydrogenase [Aquibacillus koreensis]MCT2534803.1 short-chain dehydrogenase [Aquibacillus koreensis]MDC3419586.1 short-chain dehydrogenase [Aquibacillus koreensis]